MTPGIFEYTLLRLVRRFAVTDRFLLRFGRLLPYYRTNTNQIDATQVVDRYATFAKGLAIAPPGRRVILEIGAGATNSVGYALARDGWVDEGGRILLYEPFVDLDEAADGRLRSALSPELLRRVQRIRSLDAVADASVDLVLSHSVLEHVRDPDGLMRELSRVLSPSGVMLHAVDYRDHFFKYPYHFLLFSKATWDRWLDPGDLPRWRLSDHLRQFGAHGFAATVVDSESMPEAFRAIAARVGRDFDPHDPATAVTQAVLAVRRAR